MPASLSLLLGTDGQVKKALSATDGAQITANPPTIVTGTIVRPSNTTQYTAGDVWSTASDSIITLENQKKDLTLQQKLEARKLLECISLQISQEHNSTKLTILNILTNVIKKQCSANNFVAEHLFFMLKRLFILAPALDLNIVFA